MAEKAQRQGVNFSFVTDDRIKEVLEDYWDQAHAANRAGVYAAVVVLCGGVLEGLLAWAISTKEQEARKRFSDCFTYRDGGEKPISSWDLTPLIRVAKGLDLIGITSERLLRAVQDFRNFIHPCNVIKHSARPNERLANISLETVGEVVRSLKGRMIKTKNAEPESDA